MAKVTSALAVAENSHLLESLEAGFAFPSSWYTDEDLFALERERVLLRGWHYAAHTGQLGRARDRVTLEVAGVPLVVVRNAADEIRGFVNVCRHRAHPVVAEDGNGSTLECRYDGWTYDLDGALQHMAGPEPEPRLDPAESGLIPVQTAVWGPAIWVNVEGSAPPFSEWTAGLSELVASHGLDVASHALAFEDTWSISANWKVFLDNAIECYHCPTCHPALSEVPRDGPWCSTSCTWAPATGSGTRSRCSRAHWAQTWLCRPTRTVTTGSTTTSTGSSPPPTSSTSSTRARASTSARSACAASTTSSFATSPSFRSGRATPSRQHGGSASRPTRPFRRTSPFANASSARTRRIAPPGRLLPGSEWLLQHFQRVVVESMAEPR